jgi:threonine dehydrogenase-like Zn-dependent dehydrogenase
MASKPVGFLTFSLSGFGRLCYDICHVLPKFGDGFHTLAFLDTAMRTIYVDKDIPRMLAVKALKSLWPGVVTSRLSSARFADIGEPGLPGPRWVRVQNLMCGICGSDLALLQVEADPKIAPAALPGNQRFYLGHEVVSVVTEVGEGVTRFRVGDRIVMDGRFQGASCLSQEIEPPCRHCQEGNYQLCENASAGIGPRGAGGGWGDGYTAHETEIYPVPDDISDEQAMMIEPLSVGVRAALRRLPEPGGQVLVLGAGIIGLTVVAAVRALAPETHISVIARYEHQAEMARRLGADVIIGRDDDPYQATADITGARLYTGMFGNRMLLGGFDVIYDCVGSAQTTTDSLRWTRAGGAVVMVGIKFAPLKVDLTPVWYQEVDLIGTYAHGTELWQGQRRHTYDIVIDLLRAGKLQAEPLITHRFSLEQWQEAIKTAQDKSTGAIKVAFDYR